MFANYSSPIGKTSRRQNGRSRRRRRQFEFECLEPRNLLSADGFVSVVVAPPLDTESALFSTAATSDSEAMPAELMSTLSSGHQVDVAHLGGSPTGPLGAYVVSVVGNGSAGTMSSWKITGDAPTPVHLSDNSPLAGTDLDLTVLYPAEDPELARRPFLLSRIGADGNLWLNSYHLTIPGNFVHDDTLGYGANAGVTVVEHAIAQRPAESGDDFALVVTPIIADSGEADPELRIITWQVNIDTQEVVGLMDSGPLDVAQLPAADGELSIFHQTAGVFVVNYLTESGEMVSRYVGVTSLGQVLDLGGGESGQDFDGDALSLYTEQLATAALGPSSYVAAIETDGKVELTTWERRFEGSNLFIPTYEPYLVGHSEDDENPIEKGVAIPDPVLGHAYAPTATASEHFGSAIAIGDFNGDGFDDMAVGAPDDTISGEAAAGAVTVIYGSEGGLYNSQFNWTFHQDTDGIQGLAQAGDQFGFALAAGDFDGDGRDDLAIGAPGESIEADGLDEAGVVQLLYGTANGLTAAGNQLFIQGENGLLGIAEEGDLFGWALAAGDFNEDGRDDLAIGVPFEDHDAEGLVDAGAVHVIYGAAAGLAIAANETFHQNSSGVLNSAATGDQFGYDLAVGDFNGDGDHDLAVGVPGEDAFGFNDAGAVHVFRGSSGGITTNDQFISQDGVWSNSNVLIGDISDGTETGDRFGQSLTAGNFNGDAYDDLAIGAPDEDLALVEGINHGRVHVLAGSNSGITPVGEQVWDQTSSGIATDPEPGSRFGYALGAGDVHNDGKDDLLVGIPFQDWFAGGGVTYANTGVAILMRGTAAGVTGFLSQLIEQGSFSIGNEKSPGDQLGYRVAIGDLNGDGFGDAIVGVRSELGSNFGEEPNAGAVHIVYSDSDGITDADELWFQGTGRHIRAMVSDAGWERDFGIGGGTIFDVMPVGEPEAVHVASVTKTLTLLLAVEALEAGLVSQSDPVEIGQLAADTGGSQMDPLLELDDIVPLETLLYGMMIHSGNTASVAIAQHIAVNAMGAPANDEQAAFDTFVAAMNDRADELQMVDTQVGHPAGGMVSTPQDLITLFREGWRHSLFRKFAGANISHQGESLNGDPPKLWDLVRESSYIGHDGYKGGHGRVGTVLDEMGNVINVPIGIQTHVGQATRADHSLIVGIQQSSDDHANARILYDYGFKRLFTADRRGHNDYSLGGPIIIGPGPQMGDVVDFALDHVTGNWSVSAAIDRDGHLQIINWNAEVTPGTVVSLGGAIHVYAGIDFDEPTETQTPIDIVKVPTTGPIVGDYLTGVVVGGDLRLDVWRLGAEATDAFSYLPGDYNRDLSVDAADYTLYRNTLGSTTDLRADGNENGIVDAADYQTWKSHFGEKRSVPSVSGFEENDEPAFRGMSVPDTTMELAEWVGGDSEVGSATTSGSSNHGTPGTESYRLAAIDQAFSEWADERPAAPRHQRAVVRSGVSSITATHTNLTLLDVKQLRWESSRSPSSTAVLEPQSPPERCFEPALFGLVLPRIG